MAVFATPLVHNRGSIEKTLNRFIGRERGKQISLRTLEHRHVTYRQAEGQGDQTRLVSGHGLEISGHPRPEWNDLSLLTQVLQILSGCRRVIGPTMTMLAQSDSPQPWFDHRP